MTETFFYIDCLRHQKGDETLFGANGYANPRREFEQYDRSSSTFDFCQALFTEFGQVSVCPYCKGQMVTTRTSEAEWHGNRTYQASGFGSRCHNCGWWYVQERSSLDDDIADVVRHDFVTFEGVIATFVLDGWSAAVCSAELELLEYKRGLADLHPSQVERLVGRILSQYHHCDVRHVGRSGDAGIDLLLILSDGILPVQIKHHLRSGRVEGVAPIRDFVGAIVGGGYSTGLFVTTAERYSRPAEEYATRIVRRGFQVDFVDVHELRQLIGNVVDNQWVAFDKTWNSLFSLLPRGCCSTRRLAAAEPDELRPRVSRKALGGKLVF